MPTRRRSSAASSLRRSSEAFGGRVVRRSARADWCSSVAGRCAVHRRTCSTRSMRCRWSRTPSSACASVPVRPGQQRDDGVRRHGEPCGATRRTGGQGSDHHLERDDGDARPGLQGLDATPVLDPGQGQDRRSRVVRSPLEAGRGHDGARQQPLDGEDAAGGAAAAYHDRDVIRRASRTRSRSGATRTRAW